MKSYKKKDNKRINIIYKYVIILFFICMIYNLIVLISAKNDLNKLIKISKELGLNESDGDYLVDCKNGKYDIYNNKSNKLFVCEDKIQIKTDENKKVYIKQSQLN